MRNAYGDFARYYDFLGWDKFAASAAVRLKAFFRLRCEKPKTVLDLACGTGELEKMLAGRGIRFTGVDASPEMLRMARRKCRGVRFVQSDVATVRLREKFDLVVFLFDSANHMNSLSHLLRVFKNARNHLKEGGYFIFDFLTESGLERWEHIDIRRKKDYTVMTNGFYYPDELKADAFIEAFVKKGKLYDRVYQKVAARTYPPADILKGLGASGFEKILASPYNPAEEIEEASRLWFVCS